MEKENSEVNMTKEELGNLSMALFHIHAFAKTLGGKLADSPPDDDFKYNNISDERLSLAEVIAEKTEFCLQTIGALGRENGKS